MVVLGETTFRKKCQRFGLLPQDRLRHLWVIGKTGSGKSTLLANLLAQDLAAGTGTALLDPHGDLVQTVLPLVPKERINQVLLFSSEDTEHPISFNIFRQGRRFHPDPALLTSQLIAVFRKQWSSSWGPRLEHVLRNAILAIVHDPRATLLFLYRFLTDESLRTKVVEKVTDPVVRQFWTKEFPGYKGTLQSDALAPVLNKLGAFVAQPVVRNIVAQERSRVDLLELMNSQGVLLADLASGQIGEDASHLLGGLLLSAIQLAAWEKPRGGPPFMLYVDEFQNFVNESLPSLLSESRKFGVGLTLAHQYLAQLPVALQEAVIGNVGTSIVFRLGAGDARILEPEFQPPFTAQDLAFLGPYEVAVKILAQGRQLTPFSARTPPLTQPQPGGQDRIVRIREQSRLRYSLPREQVEQSIAKALRVCP